MFSYNADATQITMHAGDTGAFKIHATRKTGEDWTEDDRMLFTVKNPSGEIVMQRFYRLDNQWGQGDGIVLIEFHNDDTDEWPQGEYTMERRYDLNPVWQGTPSTARCVNALSPGAAKMIEGDVVRTVFSGTLKIEPVVGDI